MIVVAAEPMLFVVIDVTALFRRFGRRGSFLSLVELEYIHGP